jgi:hypothetical protein
MEVQVEVRVLDPVRVVDPERHLHEPPAERRQQVQALRDEAADVVDLERPAGHGRRVVDGQPSDMPVRPGRFHRQELRVEAGQLPHRSPFRGPDHTPAQRIAAANIGPGMIGG